MALTGTITLNMLIYPHIDPVALQIGPLAIHWYGLTYLAAFGLFMLLGIRRLRHEPFASITGPAASPVGTQGATKSATWSQGRLREWANHSIETTTPSSPPWKAMPPCHTAKISSGWVK